MVSIFDLSLLSPSVPYYVEGFASFSFGSIGGTCVPLDWGGYRRNGGVEQAHEVRIDIWEFGRRIGASTQDSESFQGVKYPERGFRTSA
jgi:hypothetical protein